MHERSTKLTARTVVLILTLVYQYIAELGFQDVVWHDVFVYSVNAGWSGNAWYNNINTLDFPRILLAWSKQWQSAPGAKVLSAQYCKAVGVVVPGMNSTYNQSINQSVIHSFVYNAGGLKSYKRTVLSRK